MSEIELKKALETLDFYAVSVANSTKSGANPR